ncbi:MAG: histidine phosphatase family protein [Pseudomonadota bacterium]
MPQTSRRVFLGLMAGVVLATPAVIAPTSNVSAQGTGAFPELSDGGLVVYFRHGATTWSGIDRLEWPREQQRLLSEEGIRQSELIGEAFAKRGIPVGEVLASPFARCRDMAEIAFGRVEERMELVGLLSDDGGREERIAYLSRRVTEAPGPGLNRIIVSHTSNIAAVANVRLKEGEAVVIQPDGAKGFTILGTAMPDDWLR